MKTVQSCSNYALGEYTAKKNEQLFMVHNINSYSKLLQMWMWPNTQKR